MTDFRALVAGLLSVGEDHALSSGLFERVNAHEPVNSPGNGLSAGIWMDAIGPAVGQSGLAMTTGLIVLNVRVYGQALAQPRDDIDPTVGGAVAYLMNDYSGDLDFGAQVRNVDVLGISGTPLAARAGYLTIGDKMYRIMTITVPLIINDLFAQAV